MTCRSLGQWDEPVRFDHRPCARRWPYRGDLASACCSAAYAGGGAEANGAPRNCASIAEDIAFLRGLPAPPAGHDRVDHQHAAAMKETSVVAWVMLWPHRHLLLASLICRAAQCRHHMLRWTECRGASRGFRLPAVCIGMQFVSTASPRSPRTARGGVAAVWSRSVIGTTRGCPARPHCLLRADAFAACPERRIPRLALRPFERRYGIHDVPPMGSAPIECGCCISRSRGTPDSRMLTFGSIARAETPSRARTVRLLHAAPPPFCARRLFVPYFRKADWRHSAGRVISCSSPRGPGVPARLLQALDATWKRGSRIAAAREWLDRANAAFAASDEDAVGDRLRRVQKHATARS